MSKNQPPASFLPAAAKKESDSEGYRNSLSHTCASYSSNNVINYGQSRTVNITDKLEVHSQDAKSTHTTSSYETASKFFIQPPINSCSIQTADAQDQLPLQEVC